MIKKVIIIGKSGSGKSFLEKELVKRGLKKCIKWTDRPMRIHEIQDNDYHFITSFTYDYIKDVEFLTKQMFKVENIDKENSIWTYAIPIKELEESQVIIMTPFEYMFFLKRYKEKRDNYVVIYLDIDIDVRRNRIKSRNDSNDSIERRLKADEEDFRILKDYDIKINDENFDVDDIFYLIK